MRIFLALLVVSIGSVVPATASAAAAIDGKTSPKNSAAADEPLKNSREGHSLKYHSSPAAASYSPPAASSSSYYSAAEPSYHSPTAYQVSQAHPYPVPATSYNNPHDTSIGFVYYYLPTVQKYYPKFKDILPYFRQYEPTLRRVAERTFDIGSAVGVAVLAPVLVIGVTVFIAFMAISFLVPFISFGKRRSGRDVDGNGLADDWFDQSRALHFLSARVDRMLEAYQRALRDDRCLEKFSCEAGELSSRLGSFITNPLITWIEPFVPEYMTNKLTAFKQGARSASGCAEYTCKTFFSN